MVDKEMNLQTQRTNKYPSEDSNDVVEHICTLTGADPKVMHSHQPRHCHSALIQHICAKAMGNTLVLINHQVGGQVVLKEADVAV
jgi:hypothetical protein